MLHSLFIQVWLVTLVLKVPTPLEPQASVVGWPKSAGHTASVPPYSETNLCLEIHWAEEKFSQATVEAIPKVAKLSCLYKVLMGTLL